MDFVVNLTDSEQKVLDEKLAAARGQEAKSSGDLSRDEDLALALMNLISIEEHLAFTYVKTDDAQHLELLKEIREMRKELLQKIVRNPKGEVWETTEGDMISLMRP